MKVQYEGKWLLGKVLKCNVSSCLVCCSEKPLGIKEPQDLEPEADAFYHDWDIQPKLVKIKRSWKWTH